MKNKPYFIGADIIRILSGFGVVLIHVTDPYISYPPFYGVGGLSWLIINIVNTAFRVSVPLFIMLSGYLLLNPEKELDFKNFFKKRFLRIAIPFVFWTVFYFAWEYFFLKIPTTPISIVKDLLFVDIEHLYFIFIIMELYFITPLLHVFLKNTKVLSHHVFFIASVLFTIGLYGINAIFPDSSVKTQENLLTIFIPFISYFFAGYYLKRFKVFSQNTYYSTLVFLGLVLFTAFASAGMVNSYLRSYGAINIVAMSFLVFMVLVNMDEKKKLLQNKIFNQITKIGASTVFGIYLVHMIIINLVDKYLQMAVTDTLILDWKFVIFKVVLVFLISTIIVYSIRKIPLLKSIFG